jgi:NTE family protein
VAPAPVPEVPPPIDDGLARPRDFDARYGAGVRRALVLGGGGIVFVAWQLAYLRALQERGVPVGDADRIVGTSAGSVVATIVASGRLRRAHFQVETLAKLPQLVAAMAPAQDLRRSQLVALEKFWAADNDRPETIREIGRAALAAVTPDVGTLPRSLQVVLARRRWPGPALQVTAVDAYSGERCVITEAAGVPVHRAVAASSSVPGVFAPQPILDRRCMDGGAAGSGTHPDLVAGAERAVVLALTDHGDLGIATSAPGSFAQGIDALRATGTRVTVHTSRLPADTMLMDPREIPAALALGAQQGAEDADAIGAFLGP